MPRSLYNTRSSKVLGDSSRALSEGSPASVADIQRVSKRLQEVDPKRKGGASSTQVSGKRDNCSAVEETDASLPKDSFASYRSKKSRSKSGSSATSRTSLSSAARARLEMQIAEINLGKCKRDQALAKARAEQAVIRAEHDAEQAVIEAETDLAKAKLMADAYDGLLDLDDDDVAPSLSSHDKVSNYVASLVQPGEEAGPSNAVQVSNPNGMSGTLRPTDTLSCSSEANSWPKVVSPAETIPPVQSLNPHAASWMVPPVVVSSSMCTSIVNVSPPTSSPTIVGVSSPSPHGVLSERNQTQLFHEPAVSSGHIVTSQVSEFPSLSPLVLPVTSLVTTCLSSFASSAPAPGFHGPASSAQACSPGAQVPGPSVSTSSGCSLVSGFLLPTPRMSPTVCGSKHAAPVKREKSDDMKELAQVIVRCQDSRALMQDQRFDGDPLKYHVFIRQIQDRVLRLHGQSDPAHALQLLLDSTAGQARKLICNCVMLPASQGLQEALNLLYKAFGSPSVSIKAHLKLVCEGPQIRTDEKGLREFYSDLINCKMVLLSANAARQLDATSTADGIFSRFPRHYQEQFAKLAMKRGYNMDVVPFDLFIEFIDQVQGLASSRLGRLMATSRDHDKIQRRNSGWSRSKPARVHAVQSREIPTSSVPVTSKYEDRKVKGDQLCTVCGAPGHFIWRCEQFRGKSVAERKILVKQKRLCFNCLGVGHGVKDCPSKARCRTCAKTHHSLLHPPASSTASSTPVRNTTVEPNTPTDADVSVDSPAPKVENCGVNAARGKGARNRLQVLPVTLVNPFSSATKKIWALLDSGADTHLLSRRLFTELDLSGTPIRTKLQLANGDTKAFNTHETSCIVKDTDGTHSFHLDVVRVVDRLPNLKGSIPSSTDLLCHDHLSDIQLPDIGGGDVELIIGTGTPELHVFSEVRQGDDTKPWAGKSPLGWVLFGRDFIHAEKEVVDHVAFIATHKLDTVSESICPCQFEHADLFGESDELFPSLDDEKASKIMESSCELREGHYSMRLPWKDGCPKLPDNYNMALSRLKSLGRRLSQEPDTLSLYQNKINEMLQLGHAREVNTKVESVPDERIWYIPHHCIRKKFRIVFDCAAACQGISLNQQLLQGPDNTNTLLGVLLRFRLYPVAVVGDIKNMFHMVKVHTDDQPALRFLWWRGGNPGEPVQSYQMTVHTFGLTSSPSIAGYALRQTALQNLPQASELTLSTIQHQFYVDDLLTSVRTSNEAVQLISELDSVLSSGGFTLSKYASNRPEVLETLPSERLAPQLQDIDFHAIDLPTHKTLGLIWHASTDQFRVKVAVAEHSTTRRGLLSVLASVYDPLGIVGPFTLPAKILLQRLSKAKLDWDVEIPQEAKSTWDSWLTALPKLNGFSIPRVYTGFEDAIDIQLHFFADASKDGYGAVCYLRCYDGREYSGVLVMGKSRVAPMNQQSIPRLELCAAVTAVRLSLLVMKEHWFPVSKVYFWTDSTTVLSYVHNTSKRRPAFETNRIATIRKHTKSDQWLWVDTKQNPADLFSRGVSPRQVHKAGKWLHAPSFLLQDESTWPKAEPEVLNGDEEINSTATATVDHPSGCLDQDGNCCTHSTIGDGEQDPLWRLTNCYSTLRTAVKSVAWLLRMKTFWRNRAAHVDWSFPLNPIGGKEFEDALLTLIRLSQQQAMPDLVDTLEKVSWYEIMTGGHGDLAKTSLQSLQRFCPIVQDGVIRVGGRLQRSSYPTDVKHPIVLPKRHHVTGLVIMDAHCNSGHNASQYVLNKLRRRFHVIGQGRTVKHYIKLNCMVCRNQDANFGTQLMAPLPPARVESGKPVFENCGIDYMGPLEVKQGRNLLSRYCCIFTCLASRATHLEMIYSLTTDSFLLGLRRFLSVRGHSTRVIYSDNATNFVGAHAELKRGLQRLEDHKIMAELGPHGIDWKHAPPLASHQGGIYEAIIRLVRKAMRSMMADRHVRSLSDEGLVTLFKEIECILNNRPLTRVGTEPDDLQTLTPSMLLTGSVSPGYPSDVFLPSDGLRSSWRACQYQADQFWERWRSEYLPLLQRRQKWLCPQRNFEVGNLVLLKDESAPRNSWPKGIVDEVMPDRDSLVRRVKIRVAGGKVFTRDVRKLCLLECDT